MRGARLPNTSGLGQDGRMPLLDQTSTVVRPGVPPRGGSPLAEVQRAVEAAGWPGLALPATNVLGVRVVPVVELSGAVERLRRGGQGPVRDLETLGLWEVMPTPDTPPAPLRIVGFVATATRWDRALDQARSLSGLGAGMVLTPRRTRGLSLMDADATGVWVVGIPPVEPEPWLWVTGRTGPSATARRVTTTRQREESLFAHALDHGLVN